MAINQPYPLGLKAFAEGGINWLTDDIRIIAVDSDYTFSAAHDFLDDIVAGDRVGAAVALASKTTDSPAGGVLDAADPTLTSLPGSRTVAGFVIYKHTGSDATARLIHYISGRQNVIIAVAAASGVTSLTVDPIQSAMPTGAVITFGGGQTVTLSAGAAAGARTLAVSATANARAQGDVGEGDATSGLPIALPSGGGDIVVAFDSGPFRILKL